MDGTVMSHLMTPMRILDQAQPATRQEQVMVHETPTVIDRVALIVSNVLSDTGIVVRPDNLRPHHVLSDLGADSLDVMEIVTRAEEEFGIEIDDEMLDTSVTFGELIAAVAGKREVA